MPTIEERVAIAALRAQFLSGVLSPSSLLETCLSRIDAREHELQAWVVVDRDRARREAERQDALAARGEWLGPLHGIPIGIKDIIDVAGLPTAAGSRAREPRVSAEDAPLVARMRAAGAILLGKTVTTELACFDPPPTRNPHRLDRTPGGSSSGSAAAVADGMCVASIGSQTGGSIVRPAAYCGVAGFKPTFGVVPTEGVVPVSRALDHMGPLAGCVDDLAVLYGVLSRDVAAALPAATVELDELGLPATYQRARTARPGSRPFVFRVVEPYFFEHADVEVAAITRRAIARLGGIVETAPPLPASFADAHRQHRVIMAHDVAREHAELWRMERARLGPRIAELIEEGLAVTPAQYAAARAHQQRFRAEMAAWLAPGGEGHVAGAGAVARAGERTVVALTPSTPAPAPGVETTGDPRFNSPWSYAGFPTVTIPCGMTSDGLPCGLQIIGTAGRDWDLLAAARFAERVIAMRTIRTTPDRAM